MSNLGGPPGQVTNWKIKLSYWYISNKLLLRQVLAGLLIALSVVLYGFSLYYGLLILVVENREYQQNITNLSYDLIDYDYFREANKPYDILIDGFDAINLGGGRYDFVAKIKNPNENHVATKATFELIVGGELVDTTETFVYPGEEKYVAFFGVELDRFVSPVVSLKNVAWKRVHDFESYATPRLNFEINNTEFLNARDSGIKGELSISTLSFDVKNNTAFSYWNVGVYMVLLNDQRAVAANYVSLDNFLSGETRNVEVRFYESIPSVSVVEVLPEIEILEDSSYILPE